MPKVSVLMSVLNGEVFLRPAIESILAQTFKDFEFLIINNGSTDNTKAIIESYEDPRIVRVDNTTTLTLTEALNQGLRLAKGEYVARIDADDLSVPTRLAQQVEFLDQHPEVALIGSNYSNFELDGNGAIKLLPSGTIPSEHDELVELMASSSPIGHVTMMYRLKEILNVGGYPEHLIYAQEYGLCLRLVDRHRFAVLPDRLSLVRQHAEQISALSSWTRIRLEEAISLHKEGLRIRGLSAQGRSKGRVAVAMCLFRLARQDLRERKVLAAFSSIAQGFFTAPMALFRHILGKDYS